MKKRLFTEHGEEVRPTTRSKDEQKLNPVDVAESKRAEWERQQEAKD
ncbi:hypothetical protein [Virgibacillus phasianinus]|nr:hypothetical protein [Virgibacillus phasianinus]